MRRSDIEQAEIHHELDSRSDILHIYVRTFDSHHGVKRGFRIGMTKELFEALAEDVGEGMEYPQANLTFTVPRYRQDVDK